MMSPMLSYGAYLILLLRFYSIYIISFGVPVISLLKVWLLYSPFQKPGKDHLEPTNDRPISLTSCVCKVLENMVNDRLESVNFLTPVQYGFRKARSTTSSLVH